MTDADIIFEYRARELLDYAEAHGVNPIAIAEDTARASGRDMTWRDVLRLVNDDQIMGPS